MKARTSICLVTFAIVLVMSPFAAMAAPPTADVVADPGPAAEIEPANASVVDAPAHGLWFVSDSPDFGEFYICAEGCTPGNEQWDCQHQLQCPDGYPYVCTGATGSPCSGTCECC